jgi:peptidylprolyl isomerase
MARVTAGDIVNVRYTGRFEDGTVFDSSDDGEPLEFIAGGGDIIDGVSHGVVGMEVGESRTVTVPPEQGYGMRDAALSRKVPLDALPKGTEVGDRVSANTGGHQVVFWVTSIDGAEAVIDANHPLAGKTLLFDLHVLSARENDGTHDGCGCGHDH